MKIVVLVKEVPDTYGDRELSTATGLAARDLGDRVLDEIGERAIELAVTYAEANPGTEITMVSMGPEAITSSLRRGLALGVDSAIHVLDDELAGADLTLTADVLAAAIARAGYDLVIAGNQSTDGVGGVIPAMVAELLDIPAATALHSVEIAEGQVTGQRATDSGVEEIRAELPAIISITEALPEPRMPNFKGIVAAKKKPIETLGLSELGVAADTANTPRSIMTVAQARPPRSAGVKLVGDEDAGTKLADFLRERKIV